MGYGLDGTVCWGWFSRWCFAVDLVFVSWWFGLRVLDLVCGWIWPVRALVFKLFGVAGWRFLWVLILVFVRCVDRVVLWDWICV